MEKQIASFIRNVVNLAQVPANDQFQANLIAAKQWLEAIASGKLLVMSAEDFALATAPAKDPVEKAAV